MDEAATGGGRVVWIVDGLRLGGAERLALRFAATAAPPWPVELVALQPPPGGENLATLWGADLGAAAARTRQLAMRSLGDGWAWAGLLRQLRRSRPVLVHTHLRYAAIWGAAAARCLGVPHVTTVHLLPGSEPGRRQRWAADLEQAARRRAARVIYVSAAQKAAWGAAAGRERGVVIGNGVGPPRGAEPRAAARRRWGWEEEECVFLTVAVVRARKGWRSWLETVERLAPQRPRARFVWVGGGPEYAALAAAAAASRWSARMLTPGPRADVGSWLGMADVFLFPSEEEAQPTAVMEAMAAGLPVIATALPAVEEVLGGTGRLAPAGDAAALAAAALAWSAPTAAAARAAAAAAGRRRALAHYGEGAWRRRLLELYAEVLDENAAGAGGAHPDGRVFRPRRAAAL